MAKSGRPRGAARRQAILDATMRVIARVGTRGVTHREVAAEADVPLAATTYYFASKDDLLLEAFAAHVDADVAAMTSGLDDIPATLTPREAAAIVNDFTASDLDNNPARLVAEYELHLEASRRPALRALHQRYSEAAHAFFLELATRCGLADPEADAAIVLSVLSGLQLGELASPTPHYRHALGGPVLERLFVALAARS